MRHVNNHDTCSVTLMILPAAHAKGAVTGANVGSKYKNTFVDTVPCDDPESERCHALWRAVIIQQIMDAKTTSRNPEKLSQKNCALEWLFHNKGDFTMVCDLAGWEPDYVRSLCVRAQKRGFRRRLVISRKKSPHA